MLIYLNDTATDISNMINSNDKITLEQVLTGLQLNKPGMALAINNQVVTRNLWPTTELQPNDSLVLFSVVAGG